MTLQSKILKTKKKLSNTNMLVSIMVLALIGQLGIHSFTIRSVSLTWSFGHVPVYLPVVLMEQPKSVFLDLTDVTNQIKTKEITDKTPTVVLNNEAFFYGTVESFTKNFELIRSKFYISHRKGAPQLQKLIQGLKRYIDEKNLYSGVLILVPSMDVPAAILIQVISELEKTEFIDHVVLSGGFK